MEGNECYKFSTLRNYINFARAKPIQIVVEIGVNVGNICALIRNYFPAARIYGYEPVVEYFEIAKARIERESGVFLFNQAVTSRHLYEDAFGKCKRLNPAIMRICKKRREAGPGWMGGSVVVPEEEIDQRDTNKYEIGQAVQSVTLDEVVNQVLCAENATEIDLIKIDCEGCECSAFGSCDMETLKRIRFITGEYHGIARFYRLMTRQLYRTHKVHLFGETRLGAFFAERFEGERDGILKFNKEGMLQLRPKMCDFPIDWHHFNAEFVVPEERWFHGL